jgi:hypothetical protein
MAVETFFGSDAILHKDLQELCRAAAPSVASIRHSAANENFFEGGPAYAHKLGSLIMAVGAFAEFACAWTTAS